VCDGTLTKINMGRSRSPEKNDSSDPLGDFFSTRKGAAALTTAPPPGQTFPVTVPPFPGQQALPTFHHHPPVVPNFPAKTHSFNPLANFVRHPLNLPSTLEGLQKGLTAQNEHLVAKQEVVEEDEEPEAGTADASLFPPMPEEVEKKKLEEQRRGGKSDRRSPSRRGRPRGGRGGRGRPRGGRNRGGRRRSRSRGSRSYSKAGSVRDETVDEAGDRRPDIEKRKGGIKLFLGRVPLEVTERDIRICFEEYGRVVEVFKMKGEEPGERRHSMYHEDGFTCAFVRVASLKMGEACIEELHEQRCLIAEKRHLGAIQVAFAKGECARLGLPEEREMLPHRMEAKERVRQQREKGLLLGAASQILGAGRINVMLLSEDLLRSIVTEGMEKDVRWKEVWISYAQGGFGGTTEVSPSDHNHNSLAQFIAMRTFDYSDVEWFKVRMQDASSRCMLGEVPQPDSMPPPSIEGNAHFQAAGYDNEDEEAEFDRRAQERQEQELLELQMEAERHKKVNLVGFDVSNMFPAHIDTVQDAVDYDDL